MKKLSTIGYWKLVLFGKPEADRALYKLVSRHLPLNIVEFGLDNGNRAENLIRVIQRRCDPGVPIRYTGIDLFEGRPDGESKLPLIEAHRRLTQTGAKVRLLPGDFVGSLPRLANQLQGVELMIVTTTQSMKELAGSWFYVPRLLSETGLVMIRSLAEDVSSFLKVTRGEAEALAQRSGPVKRVA